MDKLSAKDIGIIVPLSSRETLTKAEEVSLNHLKTYLGRYDKYFVAAQKLKLDKIDKTGFKVSKFPDKFFGSVRAHNKLLTNKGFYDTFSDYKYILIYHLDSLVFSDQLIEWCEKGYDFIAPPWMASELPWLDESGVGNGGFSVRNVNSFIKLYSRGKYWRDPKGFARIIASKAPALKKVTYHLARHALKLKLLNNVRTHLYYYINKEDRGEDRFVWFFGKHYLPDFKIISDKEALSFAFEVNPRKCYEMNNNQMPFGCHAYERYDLSFWEPHLLKSE